MRALGRSDNRPIRISVNRPTLAPGAQVVKSLFWVSGKRDEEEPRDSPPNPPLSMTEGASRSRGGTVIMKYLSGEGPPGCHNSVARRFLDVDHAPDNG